MSVRIRGDKFLCGAESEPELGDIYLDEGQHQAMIDFVRKGDVEMYGDLQAKLAAAEAQQAQLADRMISSVGAEQVMREQRDAAVAKLAAAEKALADYRQQEMTAEDCYCPFNCGFRGHLALHACSPGEHHATERDDLRARLENLTKCRNEYVAEIERLGATAYVRQGELEATRAKLAAAEAFAKEGEADCLAYMKRTHEAEKERDAALAQVARLREALAVTLTYVEIYDDGDNPMAQKTCAAARAVLEETAP